MKANGWSNFLGVTWLWWIVLMTGIAIGAFVTCLFRMGAGSGDKAPWLQTFTAFFAACAFIVAVASFRFNWVKSRNDLFASMHEKLLEQDAQEARRFLSNATKKDIDGLFTPANDEKRALVNNTLALYETFCMYADKRLVNADLFDEMWGENLLQRKQAIMWFISHRTVNEGFKTWPNLSAFFRARH